MPGFDVVIRFGRVLTLLLKFCCRARMWECTGSGRCSVKRHKLLKVREMRMVCDVRTDHERAGTGESLKSSILNIWRNRVLILQKICKGRVSLKSGFCYIFAAREMSFGWLTMFFSWDDTCFQLLFPSSNIS